MRLPTKVLSGLGRLMRLAVTLLVAGCVGLGAETPNNATLHVEKTMNQDSETLFAVLYSPGPAWDPDKPMMEQGLRPHGVYIHRLLEDGSIIAAGPLIERNGGLVLMRTNSREAAQSIVADDPAITSGIFIADIQSWNITFSTAGFKSEASGR